MCAFFLLIFFNIRDISLTVRIFWHTDQLRWIENNFEEMRKVDQYSNEMKITELTLMICEKRWDEMRKAGMRWEELRWGQKRSYILRWDEVWSAKCKCGMWSAKNIMRSVRKVFVWYCLAPGLVYWTCSYTISVQELRTHARTGLVGVRHMQIL